MTELEQKLTEELAQAKGYLEAVMAERDFWLLKVETLQAENAALSLQTEQVARRAISLCVERLHGGWAADKLRSEFNSILETTLEEASCVRSLTAASNKQQNDSLHEDGGKLERDALPRLNGWISVDDQLPPFTTECAEAWASDTVVLYGFNDSGIQSYGFGHLLSGNQWFQYEDQPRYMKIENPSHWMPLGSPYNSKPQNKE